MINVTMTSKGAVDCNTILSATQTKIQGPVNAQNIETLNRNSNSTSVPTSNPGTVTQSPNVSSHTGSVSNSGVTTQTSGFVTQTPAGSASPASRPMQTQAPVQRPVPTLTRPIQKGQKQNLSSGSPIVALKACFGWNTTNPQCDVDVSAFMLGTDGKVVGDDWFVFYGQTTSPDASTEFKMDGTTDCETVSIDFRKLNKNVKKIVFVLTIHEAFEKNLNFSMIKDAYVRILDSTNNTELVSFKMTEYYSNVISMMIGELYDYNGTWKFNAVGNGVSKDLAGLCELYGVQVID